MKNFNLGKVDEIKSYEINTKDGFEETKTTMQYMGIEAIKGTEDIVIVQIAREICENVDPRNYCQKADTLFYWVRNNIKYQRDPSPNEWVQSPEVTLRSGFGDCDCMTTLLACLNMCVGNEIRFIIISNSDENNFYHIYLDVNCGESWKSYDVTMPNEPGWCPSSYALKMAYYPLDNKTEKLGFLVSFLVKSVRDFFRKFERYVLRRPFKELKRFFKKQFSSIYKPISNIARHIRDEIRRVNIRIAEEFARWEDKFGFLGKIMVIAVKWSAQRLFLAYPFEVVRMTPEEWEIGISIVTAGAGIVGIGPALAAASLDLFQLVDAGIEVYKTKKEYEEKINNLKNIKTQVLAQQQLKQEMILKLENDIKKLEAIEARYKIKGDEIELLKNQLEQEITTKEQGIQNQIEIVSSQYKDSLITSLKSYISTKKESIQYLAKVLDNRKQIAIKLGII